MNLVTRNQPRVILVTGPSINNETIIFSPIRSFVTLSFPLSSPTFRQRAPYNKLAKNPFITRLDAFSPIPQFIPHAALIRKCCVHGGTRFPFFFFPLSLSFSRHQKLERAARLIIKNGRVIDRERERVSKGGGREAARKNVCAAMCNIGEKPREGGGSRGSRACNGNVAESHPLASVEICGVPGQGRSPFGFNCKRGDDLLPNPRASYP